MGSPESKLIPPGEIGGNDVKLSNFTWRISEKPSKESIIGSNIVKSDVKEPEIPVEETTVE